MSLVRRLGDLYPVKVVGAYGKSQASNYASGLAFSMFMSAFPLILGILSLLGFVVRDPSRRATVESAIIGYFPAGAGAAIDHALSAVQRHSGILGVVSLLGLVWSGSSLFSAMEWPFDQIYAVKQRPFIRQRLMALGMTGVFVVALLVSVLANAAIGFVHGVPFLTPIGGLIVWVIFMLLLYTIVPNCHIGIRGVVRGALIAGALMEAITLLWPLYLHVSHGFDTYGSAFALFFLLATWLYFMSQVILLGLVINQLGHQTELKPRQIDHRVRAS